jgi:transposase
MIFPLRSLHVYAWSSPVDLRNGHQGLHAIVTREFKMDVLNGSMFLFFSRARKSAKVLVWDGTGLVVVHKRLERGGFSNIFSDSGVLSLTMSELSLLFEGSKVRLPLSCKEYRLNQP